MVSSRNYQVNGGALDAQGSQNLTRLLKLCEVIYLPILQSVDIGESCLSLPSLENFAETRQLAMQLERQQREQRP